MLAPRNVPSVYTEWNARWHAPFGRQSSRGLNWRRLTRFDAWRRGPFGFQPNNSTRIIEYPWAFHVAPVAPGVRVVEIGGALSGFQFVLSRVGAKVWNVDPFVDYGSGPYGMEPEAVHGRLNRYFGTDVRLCRSTLQHAALSADSFDRIYCISTIEHLEMGELKATLDEASRILRPGGLAILTVDLFLNLQPFTERTDNEWGRNISIRELADMAGMRLVYGDPTQLYGFPSFVAERILASVERYYIGDYYPALAQLLVLQKGGAEGAAAVRHDLP